MKKLTVFLCSLALVFSLAGIAGALSFDVDEVSSSVSLSNISTLGWTSLDADLAAGLGGVSFNLDEGQSASFNFLEFEANGTGLGSFEIAANLAFTAPSDLLGDFSGYGGWGTYRGSFSGGTLWWNQPTRLFSLSDGNFVQIALQQGITVTTNGTASLRATVTNLGGGSDVAPAPVPEPSTILLMGVGLLGLVAVGRRKFNPKN